jgi:DNA-directed RNA polymerase specialized sigma24 family protein
MRRGAADFDEGFTAFVRSRGEHHLRMAVLLTGDPDAAEDLVQASLLKLYRAWPRIDTSGEPDAYLRRIIVNTRRSWWRSRWRQELPVPEVPEVAGLLGCSAGAVKTHAHRGLAALRESLGDRDPHRGQRGTGSGERMRSAV